MTPRGTPVSRPFRACPFCFARTRGVAPGWHVMAPSGRHERGAHPQNRLNVQAPSGSSTTMENVQAQTSVPSSSKGRGTGVPPVNEEHPPPLRGAPFRRGTGNGNVVPGSTSPGVGGGVIFWACCGCPCRSSPRRPRVWPRRGSGGCGWCGRFPRRWPPWTWPGRRWR